MKKNRVIALIVLTDAKNTMDETFEQRGRFKENMKEKDAYT